MVRCIYLKVLFEKVKLIWKGTQTSEQLSYQGKITFTKIIRIKLFIQAEICTTEMSSNATGETLAAKL